MCENEDQETFVTTLSKGGALFLLRHSSILFTSYGPVIIAITRISWPHFGHTSGSTSYTFWISRAQLCLEALLDTVSRYLYGFVPSVRIMYGAMTLCMTEREGWKSIKGTHDT